MQKYLKQSGRFTRWVSLFVCAVLLVVGRPVAYAQKLDPNRVKISLKCDKTPMSSVLVQIEEASGFKFSFTYDEVQAILVTCNLKNQPVEKVIRTIMQGTPLKYTIEDNRIIVSSTKQPVQETQKPRPPKLKLTGQVVDQKGETLIGVSINIKGSKTVAITDLDGTFSMDIPRKGDVLLVSYIGMETQEIPYNGEEYLRIIMIESAVQMRSVVVTGVVNRKAESYTGAAITVSKDELKRVGNQNVFQSLKNLDPSVWIMDNFEMGSNPNALPEMNMRGGTSFPASGVDKNLRGHYENQPNQPLFMLDGFEVSAEKIFDLDMNQIESLTILKDASAKAIYGSKAANGVILIERKKLMATKPRITYSASMDLQMPDLSSYNLCNALEKIEVELKEKYYPGSWEDHNVTTVNNIYAKRKEVLRGMNTYWLSKPVRFGYGQKHSVSVELGEGDLRTMLSLGYNNVEGIMKGSGRNTFTGDLTLNYRLSNKLRFYNNVSITSNKAKESPYGSFSEYTVLNPYEAMYDEYGELRNLIGIYRNPYYDGTIKTKINSGYLAVSNQSNVEWSIVEGLTLRGRFAITTRRSEADTYYPASHSSQFNQPIDLAGYYRKNNGSSTRLSGDILLNYAREFGDGKHIVFSNLRVDVGSYKYGEVYHVARGLPSDNMDNILFALGYGENSRPGGKSGIERDMGITWTGSYSYRDRYYTDLTLRRNGSSQFGNEDRWANFWSVGVGWNLHNEAFMKNVKWLEKFKLTASIGTSGNQNFQNNKSLSVYQYDLGERYYKSFVGAYAANMENPDLRWESKQDRNLGLELQLLGLNMRFDLYSSITNNMVTSVATAPSTGYYSVSENIGEVKNSGYEMRASYRIFYNKNGFLNLNGSVVHNKNRILKISDAMRTYNEALKKAFSDRTNVGTSSASERNIANMPALLYEDGNDMNAIWAVRSAGIDPATGVEALIGKDGQLTYIYKGTDIVAVGTTTPKFRGTFGLNGEYKGIGLSVTCTYMAGGQYYNKTLVEKVENALIGQNFDRRVLTERWAAIDQSAYFKSLSGRTPYDMRNGIYWYQKNGWAQERTRATSRFVQNRNEVSISQVSVYYDFNRKWIKSLGLERLKISAYMNDVALFSTIRIERGTDYPFSRTLSFALTGTF